jgi:hypothetical protein
MRIYLFLVLLMATGAHASQTERAELSFSGRTYNYTFVAVVNGDADAIRSVITDYDRMQQLNDDVVESRVIERYNATELKRLLRLRQCILFFCFDITFVEHVTETAERIITTIVPQESTFSEGEASWLIEPIEGNRTRITVNAIQTPEFWIPPVLGPLILKHEFLKEVAETCAKIERIVQAMAQARQ